MRTVSNDFKNEIKKFGREFNDLIRYTIGNEAVELTQENIFSVTPRYESKLLGCTMKQLEINVDSEIPIETVLNYKIGLKIDDEYEYIDYGNYIVKSAERQEDTDSYKYICYDKMLLTMVDYTNPGIQYPITIRDYITEICSFLGLTFKNETEIFVNYNKTINNELFLNEDGDSLGFTFRDVLNNLAEAVAGNICINSNDELEIRYIHNTESSIDEEYLKDANINFKQKFGPINSIVLTRAGASDSVYLQDEDSIEENGLCEFRIEDNEIMNFNDRSEFLPGILNQLDGLEFYIFDIESTGVLFYDLYDLFNIVIGENSYQCLMLNDEVQRTQGIQESIYIPDIEKTNTDYSKADKTDIRINQTYIIVNKQKGEIEALTSRVNTIEEQTGDTYTVEQTNQLVQDAASGITNTFSEAGGNNILRNTGLWFENMESDSEQNPYEFWTGLVSRVQEENSANMNALLLKNTTVYQEQIVPNGKYTLSFNFKKLVELANVSVTINDIEYPIETDPNNETQFFTNTFDVSSKYIKVVFTSNVDNVCEIYNLMLNSGEVALAYSQNQNETTTDTVNISKGITITSSNTDTQFKANADGIRTLDKSGNELTKFTDTGMTTKKMIVQDTSQIVGLLFQEVNGQTWITKL